MERFRRSQQGMPSNPRAGTAAAGMLLAASALTIGCGSSSTNRTVNTEQVEKGIESSLSTSSVKVTGATCPSNVPVQQGGTFTCSVKLSNGGGGKVTVTQQGADHYTYAFVPGSVQIPGTTADAAIEKSLATQGAPNTTVTCPENIIVKVGTTVTCNISGAGGNAGGTVTFTFSEANGAINSQSVKTS
jgi:Domain of unknown function (DUF4333)